MFEVICGINTDDAVLQGYQRHRMDDAGRSPVVEGADCELPRSVITPVIGCPKILTPHDVGFDRILERVRRREVEIHTPQLELRLRWIAGVS
jgi:hypothetical protein